MKIKQRNIGTLWGTLTLTYQHVGMYVSGANMIISLATLYIVSTAANISVIVPVILVIVVLVSIGLFMAYKYSMPSYYAAANAQVWDHNNPTRKMLERIEGKIDEIRNNSDVPKDI